MKYYLALVVLSTLFIISCSENNVNQPVIVDDSELLSSIIGTWTSNSYTITHYADLTFIDTVFIVDSITQALKPRYARNGKFEIKNGVLLLKTEHWNIFDSSFVGNGIEVIPFETEISISGNILYKKVVEVLECTEGTGNVIWGKWKNIKWIYINVTSDTNIIYEGRQEYYYNFYKDSTKVTYGWRYLDGNPFSNPEFRSDFNYTPPYLDLNGPSAYDLRVEFKYGKMFWYYNWPSNKLFKKM